MKFIGNNKRRNILIAARQIGKSFTQLKYIENFLDQKIKELKSRNGDIIYMEKVIIQSIRDENGKIQNFFNHMEFIEEMNRADMMPDVYFTFILKTLIDDFGEFLIKATQGKINKEQFEANLITNLTEMIPSKTKEENK